ncbi:glycoside hydrolase [Podospora fimiseda]|uniref:cellulase n=1 Tax=Podospora fimiseda TaxID=252190 RepID=A0AAN7BK75_9PEZI|nr:glycoside hydrolase [Podospora fimiseda]
MKTSIFTGAAVLASFSSGVAAQGGAWAQCGGQGWSGATTCVAGYTCTFVNNWYSQCLPGGAASTFTTTSTAVIRPTTTLVTLSTSRTSSAAVPTQTAGGKFKWFGVNEAGGEFGQDTYPGVWGKHFIFPDNNAVRTLINQGYNTFRVGFAMERLSQNGLTNGFDAAYLRNLTESINFITNAGAYAVLDPHNFGRYFGNIITDVDAFGTWWNNLAKHFLLNERVIFDTNNEYHTMSQDLVLRLNQAAIDGIRSAGATSQYIFVEGNSWSGAWTWNTTNHNLRELRDSVEGKLVYQMHQYLDSDGSGTNPNCVSGEIGVQRVVGATRWLRENGKVGILGEFAGGANSVCQTAVKGLLEHLKANSDVWHGALWWSAGPWWGDYMFSFEPPSGTGYVNYNGVLRQYL